MREFQGTIINVSQPISVNHKDGHTGQRASIQLANYNPDGTLKDTIAVRLMDDQVHLISHVGQRINAQCKCRVFSYTNKNGDTELGTNIYLEKYNFIQ